MSDYEKELHYTLTTVIEGKDGHECRVMSFLQWSRLVTDNTEQLENIQCMYIMANAA
jgi:hypothetical protein